MHISTHQQSGLGLLYAHDEFSHRFYIIESVTAELQNWAHRMLMTNELIIPVPKLNVVSLNSSVGLLHGHDQCNHHFHRLESHTPELNSGLIVGS